MAEEGVGESGEGGGGVYNCRQFAAASRWRVSRVEKKCVCSRWTFCRVDQFRLSNDLTFTSAHPLRSAPLPPPTTPPTDSEANKPQLRGKMKVNIFMNGSFFPLLLLQFLLKRPRSIKIMECVTLFPAP